MSIGWAQHGTGKEAEGPESLRKAVDTMQKLVDDNPDNITVHSYLADSHFALGNLLSQTGKPAEAEAEVRKALPLYQKLAGDNPAVTVFRSGLALTHSFLGRLLAREKRFPEAFTALETGLAIFPKLVDADPKDTRYKVLLGWSYACRGGARVRAGKPADAAADLRRAVEMWARVSPHLDTEMKYELARALALLAGLGGDAKSGVTKDEARTFADQSVAALADAVKAGWALPRELKERDFDALRGRDDFRNLVAELEAKVGPKAKPKD
jgi:tetratricopeptide (TPR) repeat protein